MDQAQLKKYQRKLEELAPRMRSVAAGLEEETRTGSGGQAAGQLSNAPMHLGDTGTEEYLHDINATLMENESYLAGEVNDALQRIQAGTFGNCENCEKPIRRERLDAIPYARYCVQCAEEIGAGAPVNLNAGRPRTPDDTIAPEGDMGEDRHTAKQTMFSNAEKGRGQNRHSSTHAAGTAGGGTAVGGLAGGNSGNGEPDVSDLDDAMDSGNFDAVEAGDDDGFLHPQSGGSGGAVGGTPAGKRRSDISEQEQAARRKAR